MDNILTKYRMGARKKAFLDIVESDEYRKGATLPLAQKLGVKENTLKQLARRQNIGKDKDYLKKLKREQALEMVRRRVSGKSDTPDSDVMKFFAELNPENVPQVIELSDAKEYGNYRVCCSRDKSRRFIKGCPFHYKVSKVHPGEPIYDVQITIEYFIRYEN